MTAGAVAVTLLYLPETPVAGIVATSHGPIGVAKGFYPGRVVWVHAPEATSWDGFESAQHWWQEEHTMQPVVGEMISAALRGVAGETSDRAAWEAIFKYFNTTHDRGARGYQVGEKIAIKINLTACNARSWQVNAVTYEKEATVMNSIDNSPQMLLGLLRQLVYVAGVAPQDIAVGDPTGLIPQFMYDRLHPEFPAVQYFDNYGKAGSGRTRTEFSTVRFDWSTPDAVGKLQDYIPIPFAQADYLINFAVLKGHSAGITACGKNLYGALLRCPDGYLREVDIQNYYSMHLSLAGSDQAYTPGMGHYRALVDLMGHPQLGGKTLLNLVDGLFGGYYWDSHPYKWKMPPFGDGVNGAWPSSLLASQDPVAIDSVAYDFLVTEWPKVVDRGGSSRSMQGAAEDYLHEAAAAGNPPSGSFYDPGKTGTRLASLGVHEHWNNAVDKQYSRNLGLTNGIELVALKSTWPTPQLTVRRAESGVAMSWPVSLEGFQLQSTPGLNTPVIWSPVTNPPVLAQGWYAVSNETAGASRLYRLVR